MRVLVIVNPGASRAETETQELSRWFAAHTAATFVRALISPRTGLQPSALKEQSISIHRHRYSCLHWASPLAAGYRRRNS